MAQASKHWELTSETSAATAATAATTAIAVEAILLRTPERTARLLGRRKLALSDESALLVDVLLLAHDLQIVTLPLRKGIQGQESLGLLGRLKLDEHRTLEQALGGASQTDSVDCLETGKEGLNIELRRRLLVTETLSVDGAGVEVAALGWRVGLATGDELLARLAREDEVLAVLEGVDDSLIWLEVAHATKTADDAEGNGAVLGATNLGP